jgi:hypothetical protein
MSHMNRNMTAERATRHAEACESMARTINGSATRRTLLLEEAAEWRRIAAEISSS